MLISFQEQVEAWEKALEQDLLSPKLLLKLPQDLRHQLLLNSAEAARQSYEMDPELDFTVEDDFLEEE